MSGSADMMVDTLLRAKVRQLPLELPALDKDDIPTDQARPHEHAPYKCHQDTYRTCGVDAVDVNGGVIQDDGAGSRGHFCPIEWTTDSMSWCEWTTVNLGVSDKTGKMSSRDEFLKRFGTRR